jgi:hypothetical protein
VKILTCFSRQKDPVHLYRLLLVRFRQVVKIIFIFSPFFRPLNVNTQLDLKTFIFCLAGAAPLETIFIPEGLYVFGFAF